VWPDRVAARGLMARRHSAVHGEATGTTIRCESLPTGHGAPIVFSDQLHHPRMIFWGPIGNHAHLSLNRMSHPTTRPEGAEGQAGPSPDFFRERFGAHR
jgi:hypothetical protein